MTRQVVRQLRWLCLSISDLYGHICWTWLAEVLDSRLGLQRWLLNPPQYSMPPVRPRRSPTTRNLLPKSPLQILPLPVLSRLLPTTLKPPLRNLLQTPSLPLPSRPLPTRTSPLQRNVHTRTPNDHQERKPSSMTQTKDRIPTIGRGLQSKRLRPPS